MTENEIIPMENVFGHRRIILSLPFLSILETLGKTEKVTLLHECIKKKFSSEAQS